MVPVTPETLRELRRRLGAREGKPEISQAELARRLGANNMTVWRWEQGRARPRGIAVATLQRMMAEVGMDDKRGRDQPV